MPVTFFQRLTEYRKRPDAIQFSKRKLKRLHSSLSCLYNRQTNGAPRQYVESMEDGEVFTVILYPDTFTRTIDALILRLHKETLYLNFISKPLPVPEDATIIQGAARIHEKDIITKPQRKRKPLKAKYYSAPKKPV